MLHKSSSATLGGGGSGSGGESVVMPIGEAIANGAGLYANDIQNTRDALEREYGSAVKDVKLYVADMNALGMSDGKNVYMSRAYSSNKGLTESMKQSAKEGFHPKIGKKSGAEAVTAHEFGHVLSQKATSKAGVSEREIVKRAGKKYGEKVNYVAGHISRYARYNYSETIAEAFADVYCNGNRANKFSRAIVSEVKSLLK